MKTILIPVTTNFFSRNILRTDAYPELLKSGCRIVMLVPPGRLDYYRAEFAGPDVLMEPLENVKRGAAERTFAFLETASIHSRTEYMLQRSEYVRRRRSVSMPVRFLTLAVKQICWTLGRQRRWRALLRRAYAWFPNRAAGDLLNRYRPDLVFVPTMIGADYPFLKEAKKRGIRTAGMVLSWDNLFSKTLLLAHPDRLLVHTEYLKEQAANLGDYPPENIIVTGVPQYDRYFQKKSVPPRGEFIRALGGDPCKKLILYAFSGKAGIGIEIEVVKILYEIIREGLLGMDTEVLLRPYPRYDFPEEKLERMKRAYGFLARPAVAHVGTGKDSWEFDAASLDFLHASLAHADAVVTMYSTFFIEAAIFDKPTIGIAFDADRARDRWNSATRFFEWEHLARIKRFDGIDLVRSRGELAASLRRGLEQSAYKREARAAIVRDQCSFLDGRAGHRVAAALLDMI